jgi:hypothetical protein
MRDGTASLPSAVRLFLLLLLFHTITNSRQTTGEKEIRFLINVLDEYVALSGDTELQSGFLRAVIDSRLTVE